MQRRKEEFQGMKLPFRDNILETNGERSDKISTSSIFRSFAICWLEFTLVFPAAAMLATYQVK